MKNEYELIDHHKVNNIKAFVIEINYRRPHLHTDLEIIYVLEGTLTVRLEQKTVTVEKGQFFLLNTCQLHEFISKETAQLLIIQFNTRSIEHLFPEINEILFDNAPVNHTLSPSLLQNYLTLSRSYFKEDELFHLACQGYAILTLFELVKVVPYTQITSTERDNLLSRNDRISRVSQYIQRNYNEKILLSELAQQENITTSYLSNFIKTHFGYTFQELVNFTRCEKAKHLLVNTKSNLLTISQNCGFSDVRYLNKSFKAMFGMTPQQYRIQTIAPEKISEMNDLQSVDIQHVLTKDQSIEKIEQLFDSIGKRLLHV
ncbi:helix-turn-helix domain-containing protein [Macrococcus sp. EM39E]|uniref:helix-turn-helix domain-containing protein n=1 Tax=Macrococcus animalis TaxID=3395467 RepID=UPI0039BEB169